MYKHSNCLLLLKLISKIRVIYFCVQVENFTIEIFFLLMDFQLALGVSETNEVFKLGSSIIATEKVKEA